jgi:anti-sigma factor RsiW
MSWWSRRRALRCDDFVELVTDYLDGAVPDDERARIERHLRGCDGCTRVLAQWREVIRITGHLDGSAVDRLDDAVRSDLMAAFASSHGDHGPPV